MQKTEKQLGNVKIAGNDPTLKFTNKIQKILSRLKEKKFTDKENISKYIHQIQYHRYCMVQQKLINQRTIP